MTKETEEAREAIWFVINGTIEDLCNHEINKSVAFDAIMDCFTYATAEEIAAIRSASPVYQKLLYRQKLEDAKKEVKR